MIAALVASLLACLVALARVRAAAIRLRIETWEVKGGGNRGNRGGDVSLGPV